MTRVLFLTLLTTIAVSFVVANDLNLGGPVDNDHSVRNATVIRKPRRHPQRVVIGLGDGSNITSIRAVNHNVTNNASVSVVLGGIGHHAVILYFRAPCKQGLNFTVEVRGVRPPKPSPPPPPPTRPPPPPPPTRPPPPPPVNSTESVPSSETTEPVPPSESTVPPQQEEEEEVAEEVPEESSLLKEVYFANN